MKKLVFILCAAVALFSMSQMAVADTVTYSGLTYTPAGMVHITSPIGPGTYNAGQFNIAWNGDGTWAYCVDLTNTISPGTYDATPSALSSGYFKAAYLLDLYRGQADTANESAGLQMAIWKSIYGASFTFDSVSDPAITTYYNMYVASLAGFDPGTYQGYSNYTYLNLYNVGSTTVRQGLITGVAEPMTMILFGLGLIGLAGLRRKE
jgi:hypothetical protein